MTMEGKPGMRTGLRLPIEEAEWWGAALAVLVAVFDHPHLLADQQPETDPTATAREVRVRLPELTEAIGEAAAETDFDDLDLWRQRIGLQRDGDDLVISPAREAGTLAWCLDVFSAGVLDRESPQAAIAQGGMAYAASAWSGDIGGAAGTPPPRRRSRRRTGPGGAGVSHGGGAS